MWPAGSQTHGSRAGGRSWRTTSVAQGLSASSPRPICTGSSWRSSRRASRPTTSAWLSCAVVKLSGPILLVALLLLALCAASCGPSRRYSTTIHRGLDRVGPLEIDYEPSPPPHTTRADLLRAIATVLGAHAIDFAWSPPPWTLRMYWAQPAGSYAPCSVPNGGGCFDAPSGSISLSHDAANLYHELTHLWAWVSFGNADPGHSRPEWARVSSYTPP